MNAAWLEALREAYASAPSNVRVLDTIELRHPAVTSIFLVHDRKDFVADDENGVERTYRRSAFRFQLPEQSDQGLQELRIQVDNVTREASSFCQTVKFANTGADEDDPVEVIYRPYLSNDTTGPQMDPPLRLYLKGVAINLYDVTGTASFADMINQTFPNEKYTRARFPGLFF